MAISSVSLNCPPGLEYLLQIDRILVQQEVDLTEILAGFESSNKYKVLNCLGQVVYLAIEKSNWCNRQFFGPLRSFSMHILDPRGNNVMQLVRPLRCSGCFGCCMQQLEVQAPPGIVVGYIVQTWHPFLPRFIVQNELKEPVLKIHGPCCVSCRATANFEIKSLDESEIVGKISKQFPGLIQGAFANVDFFGIQFPLDLDVRMKAIILGACLLIVSITLSEQ